uniref:G-protein coupled receptors family 2 profile 2 domain-containing protein n=1 Tax=Glossina brevipalpis TaxID=37001 RepID=A0A1A9WE59_9MUSC
MIINPRDILSGVCFVGQLDTHSLGVFLIIPLCIYLSIGALFLLAGFVSLFRIRTVMKTDGKRTDKLERLMMRIGFFSGLFILPALGYLGCLFYEYYNFDDWMIQWHRDICKPFSIPCPVVKANSPEARPIFQIYMVKYLCSMLVGVTSSVWLYSSKTVMKTSFTSLLSNNKSLVISCNCINQQIRACLHVKDFAATLNRPPKI